MSLSLWQILLECVYIHDYLLQTVPKVLIVIFTCTFRYLVITKNVFLLWRIVLLFLSWLFYSHFQDFCDSGICYQFCVSSVLVKSFHPFFPAWFYSASGLSHAGHITNTEPDAKPFNSSRSNVVFITSNVQFAFCISRKFSWCLYFHLCPLSSWSSLLLWDFSSLSSY